MAGTIFCAILSLLSGRVIPKSTAAPSQPCCHRARIFTLSRVACVPMTAKRHPTSPQLAVDILSCVQKHTAQFGTALWGPALPRAESGAVTCTLGLEVELVVEATFRFICIQTIKQRVLQIDQPPLFLR